MSEFLAQIHGSGADARGTLLVDGAEPDLFGCTVERVMPLEPVGTLADPVAIRPFREDPTVEVTLRLPMRADDTLTLVRDDRIETYYGPTSDVRSTGPGAVALLDRWLAAHPNEDGGSLIAKARELLTGERAPRDGDHARRLGELRALVDEMTADEPITDAERAEAGGSP